MDNLKKRLNKKGGFTLVELLVVIAIIAILSVTAFISLGGETIKARDSKRKDDLALIQNALEIYFINESEYPDDLNIDKKYLSEEPMDPKTGAGYLYKKSGAAYLLGASLEMDGDPTHYEAYLVGNADESILTGEGCNGCNVSDGGSCLPYCL